MVENLQHMEQIRELRHVLHSHAEISGQEYHTLDIIRTFLTESTGLEVMDYSGGIAARYRTENPQEGPVAFRADFDGVALPDGCAAHLCGHDGHTAALLGVAVALEERKPCRDVLLIFQPSEETGEGAPQMIPLLKKLGIREVYGCHNLPGYPLGQVYTTPGTFACASSGMTLYFTGRPAHAAYPEFGVSPAPAVAAFLDYTVHCRREEAGTFATVIGCRMGQKAFGTAAEKAEVWLTLRARTNEAFLQLKQDLTDQARHLSEAYGLSLEIEEQDIFPATVNHSDCAHKVLTKTHGRLLEEPMRWSEDFGHYLKEVPGAFFGIGAGDVSALHTAGYEYPDGLLEYQINAFLNLLDI